VIVLKIIQEYKKFVFLIITSTMNFVYSFLSYLDQNHTGNWWSYLCGPA